MRTKTTDELLEDARTVSSAIAAAHQLMSVSQAIDFPNLEKQIQALCENADADGLEQSAEVQDALGAIVEDLTRLNSEMSAKLWDAEEQSTEEAAQQAIATYSTRAEEK